ncbi:hypothetical protein SAMN04489740_2737 [Arthrobacter alpinus]|uniref:HTH cro/C1-type domain-containing protein n=1 Tax=Arthrobacter alpinus TaxID=656366 RepID=A0A1H5M3Y4_9MICC|nr:hypothetical protein [Arthrobacter alpinus]SEE83930.1 hypothetical protein SAMN04489740_2737 [Arthrobacter alpinus]
MITTQNAEQNMSAHIRSLVANSGVSKTFIYNAIGISRETFNSRLMNPYSFTYRDLLRMADALRLPVESLFPVAKPSVESTAE